MPVFHVCSYMTSSDEDEERVLDYLRGFSGSDGHYHSLSYAELREHFTRMDKEKLDKILSCNAGGFDDNKPIIRVGSRYKANDKYKEY